MRLAAFGTRNHRIGGYLGVAWKGPLMSRIKNPNHPKKGSSIKADPIRDVAAIARIKDMLRGTPRDHLLFVMGVNTAYRINELLSLQVRHVLRGTPGHIIDLKQSKQNRYRAVMVNEAVCEAVGPWLDFHPDPHPCAPLFWSGKTGNALTVPTCSRMVKHWCMRAGLSGQFSAHSLRKTWGYTQRVRYGQPIDLIMRALGHSSERETLLYLGILPSEVLALYRNVV